MRFFPLLCSSAALLFAANANAQIAGEPRADGMAGASRADPLANSAMVSNPAGLSRGRLYAAEVQFSRTGVGDRNAAAASIVDSKTQPNLAVGISYSYEWADSDAEDEVSGHDARLEFAHQMMNGNLNIGFGLRYVNFKRDIQDDFDGFTLSLGLHGSLTENFAIALMGENIIPVDEIALPRRAGGGLAFTSGTFTLEGDVLADFDSADSTKPVFAVSMEALLGQMVPIRVGYERNNATETDIIAAGLGFLSIESGRTSGTQVNVSYKQDLSDSKNYFFSAGLIFYL